MEKIKQFLSDTKNIIAALTVIIGTASTGLFWVDARYAKASSVVELRKDLTLIELKDQLREAQDEYFFLKKKSRQYPEDEEIREELTEAKQVVSDIRAQIKKLKEKQ